MSTLPIAVAITGASGAMYGLTLIEKLLQLGETVYLMISKAGLLVIAMETDLKLSPHTAQTERFLSDYFHAAPGQLRVFGQEEWTAPVASGSSVPRAMVVCPCTSGTLAAIAHGLSQNLIERAADVVLKERRLLILVHRETPLSSIQLENMLTLTRAGAVILPANPGFYHRPKQVDELIIFIVARILDQLRIEHSLLPRWGVEMNE
ncbi:flavin prenyltransferase UbiX [Thioflexithrix psekupsensis]|uniref:Flavin prenyltransferase UbiX n=1 Tax=Thioflexithrix psekupsensis TaxID=1570016 RepID=A0A251X9B0_9GAMM|nr:flavin prenyltransferase UbiX [Thioflexithrix psekupsensis]OUD14384.1 aromatic acid decarboxylase [Thioflexithrix psekupsensis]